MLHDVTYDKLDLEGQWKKIDVYHISTVTYCNC